MSEVEYLLSYGVTGEFGRFHAARPLACRRGDRAVIRSARGLEVGQVLQPARPRHAAFLPNTTVGQLLRLLTPDDEANLARVRERGRQLFDRADRLTAEMQLPLEMIDAEVLLDGEHGQLHLLRGAACDLRPFVSALSREFALYLQVTDLTRAEEEEHHGCGREGCGEGGCGGCGSGGGCGSCGAAKPQDESAYFAELREQMERRRTALL